MFFLFLCFCVFVVLRFTFQNVSLSTHVNFDSVVLSDLDLSARLFALRRGRGLAFTFARVLVRAPIDGPGSKPTDIGDHSVCTPCSRAHFGRVTTACVSSPRDWAVSIGSHMQQDMDISKAPPHLGAPVRSV